MPFSAFSYLPPCQKPAADVVAGQHRAALEEQITLFTLLGDHVPVALTSGLRRQLEEIKKTDFRNRIQNLVIVGECATGKSEWDNMGVGKNIVLTFRQRIMSGAQLIHLD